MSAASPPRVAALATYIYHYIKYDKRDPKPGFVLAEARDKELLDAARIAYQSCRMERLSLSGAITAAVAQFELLSAEQQWVLARAVDTLIAGEKESAGEAEEGDGSEDGSGDEEDNDDDDDDDDDGQEHGNKSVQEQVNKGGAEIEAGNKEIDQDQVNQGGAEVKPIDAKMEREGDYTWHALLCDAFGL